MLTPPASPAPCAPPATDRARYRPRHPETTVLYRVVARHLPAFLERTEADASRSSLPVFVRREFLALLDCGIAELPKRVFVVDVLRCACGGRRRILAASTGNEVIRAILAAPHLPTEPPAVPGARGPPELFREE